MTTIIKVKVFLSKVGETTRVTYRSPYAEVVSWYHQQLEDLAKMLFIRVDYISFSRDDDCLVIAYTRKDECDEMSEVIADMLADPDDDCNCPIMFGDEEYFISGEVII